MCLLIKNITGIKSTASKKRINGNNYGLFADTKKPRSRKVQTYAATEFYEGLYMRNTTPKCLRILYQKFITHDNGAEDEK